MASGNPPKGGAEFLNPWDTMAEQRAEVLRGGLDRSYEDLCLQVIDGVKEAVALGSSVLDLGCGVGYLSRKLSEAGYKVVGADIAPKSIALARREFGVEAVVGGALEALRYHNGQPFDAIVANMVVHCVEDLASFYREAAAALKPGGLLFVTAPNEMWVQNHKETLSLQESWSDGTFSHTIATRAFAAAGMNYQAPVEYYLRHPVAHIHYAFDSFDPEGLEGIATPLDRRMYALGEVERSSQTGRALETLEDIELFTFRKREAQ